MATKKKKSGKQKRPPKPHGHYCKICGEHKANEKFSGSGHAAHICKACASKSPAQKSEDMTINRLHGMMFRYLNESEMKWLKNRRNDSRPEVKELAQGIFEEKFPRQARGEIKAQLHIKSIVFHYRGEIMNSYGDEYYVNVEFAADTSGKIVKKTYDENETFIEEKTIEIGVKAARKFFNVMVHSHEISFWETDLCHNESYDTNGDFLDDDEFDFEDDKSLEDEAEQADDNDDDEVDDRIPDWSVEIKYTNGKEQNIKDYDGISLPVMELFDDFDSYFEDEESDEDWDEDEDNGDNVSV